MKKQKQGWTKERQEKFPESWAKVKSKFNSKGKSWKLSEESKKNQREAFNSGRFTKDRMLGKNNVNWKGENVGYHGIHKWVSKWKGKPKKCELCGTEIAKKYEWANTDHKYRRVLDDYIRMCTSCHREYDFKKNVNTTIQ